MLAGDGYRVGHAALVVLKRIGVWDPRVGLAVVVDDVLCPVPPDDNNLVGPYRGELLEAVRENWGDFRPRPSLWFSPGEWPEWGAFPMARTTDCNTNLADRGQLVLGPMASDTYGPAGYEDAVNYFRPHLCILHETLIDEFLMGLVEVIFNVTVPSPLDQFTHAVLKSDLWLEAQEFSGSGDIGIGVADVPCPEVVRYLGLKGI